MNPHPDSPDESETLTVWLHRMSQGDPQAAEYVAESVYRELRLLAQAAIHRENRRHSLQPTLLVNEAFVRLLRGRPIEWQDRRHFFAMAAKKMRQIIVDYFRHKDAAKVPPEAMRIELEDIIEGSREKRDEALIVDEALTQFAEIDSRAAQVVELRYFAGLTIEEIAALLEYDVRTIKRDWEAARWWLRQFLSGAPKSDE